MRNHRVTGFFFEKPPSDGIISIRHIGISHYNPLQNIAKPYNIDTCLIAEASTTQNGDMSSELAQRVPAFRACRLPLFRAVIFFEALGRSILLAVQCSQYRVAIGQVHNAWLDHVPRLKKWQGNLRRSRLITLVCLLKALKALKATNWARPSMAGICCSSLNSGI